MSDGFELSICRHQWAQYKAKDTESGFVTTAAICVLCGEVREVETNE